MAPRATFDSELEALNNDLIKMGALVEEAITLSIDALLKYDHDLSKKVITSDNVIDDLEKVIETRCLRLLMRQQPVARDLRTISTALKMITDLERIGDQAADIADLSLRFENESQLSIAKHIPEMSRIAINMVRSAIDSYVKNDIELAKATMQMDDKVDELFGVVKRELIKTLGTTTDRADEAIDLMMVAKYLERIGDHAVNVCEWVIFYSTGQHKTAQIL
ncbi:MAG TPA: phosphate transport system regulatory protein PhoU [Ruminococcaceae bacterium]|nr:phosphate transport system regulatory protein PhoU [Oscillospiraceae bacterium]